jgi:hypothetical protein
MNTLLQQMTPPQFHSFFANRDHIALEKADMAKDFKAIENWLSTGEYELKKAFLDFHIKMTTPVFGKWNWTKRVEGWHTGDYKGVCGCVSCGKDYTGEFNDGLCPKCDKTD